MPRKQTDKRHINMSTDENKVVIKREIMSKVAHRIDDVTVTRELVVTIVEKLLAAISEELVQGNDVVFRGFGRFEIITSKEKTGRNPKKPEKAIAIPATRKVRFKVGNELKKRIADTSPRMAPPKTEEVES